jgi:hypothetical protein
MEQKELGPFSTRVVVHYLDIIVIFSHEFQFIYNEVIGLGFGKLRNHLKLIF